MAEGAGFEPAMRLRIPAFQASALGQLCDPSGCPDLPTYRPAGRPAAERAGFEPAVARHHTAFREQHLKPLGHLSARDYTKGGALLSPSSGSRVSFSLNREPARQRNKPPLRGGFGTPGRIRTCGLWVRNPTLYPLSYRRMTFGAQTLWGGCRRLEPLDRSGGEGGIRTLEGK